MNTKNEPQQECKHSESNEKTKTSSNFNFVEEAKKEVELENKVEAQQKAEVDKLHEDCKKSNTTPIIEEPTQATKNVEADNFTDDVIEYKYIGRPDEEEENIYDEKPDIFSFNDAIATIVEEHFPTTSDLYTNHIVVTIKNEFAIVFIKTTNNERFSFGYWFLYNITERKQATDIKISHLLCTVDDRYATELSLDPFLINTIDIKSTLFKLAQHLVNYKLIDYIELNTENEIPMPSPYVIPKMSFSGLPEYSLVSRFLNEVDLISDTYIEYGFQYGMALMATSTKCRVKFSILEGISGVNLFLGNIGRAGYSRKSKAHDMATEIIDSALGEVYLGTDFTKEGLSTLTADIIETVTKGVLNVESQEMKYPVRKAVCSFFRNEAGSWFTTLKQTFNDGLKNQINNLFDSAKSQLVKDMSKAKYITNSPYWFNGVFNTTPEGYIGNLNVDDIESGFVPRQQTVWPDYKKDRKPITSNVSDSLYKAPLSNELRLIDRMIPQNLIVTINKDVLAWWDTWCGEREDFFADSRNNAMGSWMARNQMTILKMAILIELSCVPAYINAYESAGGVLNASNSIVIDDKIKETALNASMKLISKEDKTVKRFNYGDLYLRNNITITHLEITPKTLKACCDIFDKMYIPYMTKIMNEIGSSNNDTCIKYMFKSFNKNPVQSHSTLMKNLHMKSKDFKESIDTLKELGVIKQYYVRGVTQPKAVYVYCEEAYSYCALKPIEDFKGNQHTVLKFTVGKKDIPPIVTDSDKAERKEVKM